MTSINQDLENRFCRYVQIYTASDPNSDTKPSSERQWDLLNLLYQELKELGPVWLEKDPKGYVMARFSANPAGAEGSSFVLLAHVDTSPDAPGEHVVPVIHNNYDGKLIKLKGGIELDPASDPLLKRYEGQTIITSDGTTLLGADDKAGVAIIMTTMAWLKTHPDLVHPEIEVVFTSDEEIGRGVEGFPLEKITSKRAYTFDGSEEDTIENECYEALCSHVTFYGNSHHPGYARGKLINAITMAGIFVSLLPRNESPEATDGRIGCLWANHLSGELEKAEVQIMIRDFEPELAQKKVDSLSSYAKAVEASFPGSRVEITTTKQYSNMKPYLDKAPLALDKLVQAVRATGAAPVFQSIRGGTDGARLTELGLPTPNVFTGSTNFHSRKEWVALPAMEKAVQVALQLAVQGISL